MAMAMALTNGKAVTRESQCAKLSCLIEEADKKLHDLELLLATESTLDINSYTASVKLFQYYAIRQLDLKEAATKAMTLPEVNEQNVSPRSTALTVTMRKAAIKKSYSAKNLAELGAKEGSHADGSQNPNLRSSMRYARDRDFGSLDRKQRSNSNTILQSEPRTTVFGSPPVTIDWPESCDGAVVPGGQRSGSIKCSNTGPTRISNVFPRIHNNVLLHSPSARCFLNDLGSAHQEGLKVIPSQVDVGPELLPILGKSRIGVPHLFEETKPFEMEDFYKYSTKFRSTSSSSQFGGASSNFKTEEVNLQAQEQVLIPQLDDENLHLYTKEERLDILKLHFMHNYTPKSSNSNVESDKPPVLPPKTKSYSRRVGHISSVRSDAEEEESISYAKPTIV